MQKTSLRNTAIFAAVVAALFTSQSARATSGTWTGTTDATWAGTGNWSATPVPGTGNTATFSGAGNGNTTIDLGAGVTLGALLFDTSSAAAYTIGSGGAGSQTLTLSTVGNAITMNSTVANNELVNANLALATTGTYTVTNSSTTNTLTLAGGISASTAGIKVLSVTGSGNTAISGAITAGSGVMGLVKLGTGTLTLSGGGAFGAAAITTYGGSNSAVLLGGTTKISSGTYTSAGEFVVGGVLANGGAGVNTNFTMDGGSLSTAFFSLGRGNGVGAVSSDIVLNNSASITSTGFSAGFNGGNVGNTPKTTFTLNGSSSFAVTSTGAFTLGESASSNSTMTLNGTSTVTIGTGVTAIGNQNGTGILTINSGTTFTNGGEIRVAYSGGNGTFTGSGTINVGGGTLNTVALTVARNNNDVASTLNGTVNLTAGTINVTTSTSLIGWRGTSSTGTLNISGGNYNQASTSGSSNMNIGSFSGVTGAVNVSGGALNLDNNSSLTFSDTAAASPTGTLTISGGAVTFYSNTAGTTVGGTGVVDLMKSTGTGTNTINLNGGTLTANQIKVTSATGTRVINFNGGTLKSGASGLASTFLANGVATTANVRDGGAIIDTNGNTVTIGQALTHSAIGGDNATDGGLTKSGTGTLTLSGANTYTGTTKVVNGTLALTGSIASTGIILGQSGVSTGILDVTSQASFSKADFSGSGTINIGSGKTVTATGNVAPGFSAGTLAVTGNFTLASTAATAMELAGNGGTAGTDFDKINVTGTLTYGGALTISSFGGYNLNQVGSYDLFDATTLSGDLTSVTVGGTGLTFASGIWTGGNYTFTESTGILSVVPEPSAWAMLVGGLGMLVGIRQFRRRRVN